MKSLGMPPQTGFEGWMKQPKGWSKWLERLFLIFEQPVNRLSTTPQLNPFYHTGPISLFLLGVVAATGFYLFIFFQYGYEASYMAAFRLEGQPIGRLMRALHRYASGALLITTLLHALRMLFMERFHGPRRLAWITGQVMVAMMWVAGVTGYLLLWDERAKQINDRLINYLDRWTPWGARFANWQIGIESGGSWLFFFVVLVVHIVMTLALFGFFYLHIKHLSRARLLPEGHWLIGMGIVLIIGALFFPVGMLPAAQTSALSGPFTYDPVFLFFLPNSVGWVIWTLLFVVGLGLTFLPWLSRESSPAPIVNVISERCTGCTRCATDCPYGAIDMLELSEGSAYSYLAVAQPERCVSCGICIGACRDNAITLGEADPADLKEAIKGRLEFAKQRVAHETEAPDIELVFTCQRFANQGAAPYLRREVHGVEATHRTIEVMPIPCAGAISPDLLIEALNAGAAEVRLIGCPPDDCANREGNLIAEQRLMRERPPKLRRSYANVPISAVWLPP
ncbi:MAG: hydrogenase iron-sulfur subunit, partial [Chloroflexota bacterium]